MESRKRKVATKEEWETRKQEITDLLQHGSVGAGVFRFARRGSGDAKDG
jgi:hypothetical protein